MSSTLQDMVLALDWAACELARGGGDTAAQELHGLLGHGDRQVRILVVTCMEVAGGALAGRALVDALRDPDAQVRITAARGLRAIGATRLQPELLQIFDDSADDVVRREIALVIGFSGGTVDLAPLEERWKAEASKEGRLGLAVALGNLGNESARQEFSTLLSLSSGDERDRLLRYAELICQSWLLSALRGVLDDETALRYLGPHGRDVDMRACDIAVNLIARISGWRCGFEVGAGKNYSPSEIQVVRREVDAHAKRAP